MAGLACCLSDRSAPIYYSFRLRLTRRGGVLYRLFLRAFCILAHFWRSAVVDETAARRCVRIPRLFNAAAYLCTFCCTRTLSRTFCIPLRLQMTRRSIFMRLRTFCQLIPGPALPYATCWHFLRVAFAASTDLTRISDIPHVLLVALDSCYIATFLQRFAHAHFADLCKQRCGLFQRTTRCLNAFPSYCSRLTGLACKQRPLARHIKRFHSGASRCCATTNAHVGTCGRTNARSRVRGLLPASHLLGWRHCHCNALRRVHSTAAQAARVSLLVCMQCWFTAHHCRRQLSPRCLDTIRLLALCSLLSRVSD